MTNAADRFWIRVDDLFSEGMADSSVPRATVLASALQASCLSAMAICASEAEFLEMAKMAWAKSLLDVRTHRAEELAEEGKAAKA